MRILIVLTLFSFLGNSAWSNVFDDACKKAGGSTPQTNVCVCPDHSEIHPFYQSCFSVFQTSSRSIPSEAIPGCPIPVPRIDFELGPVDEFVLARRILPTTPTQVSKELFGAEFVFKAPSSDARHKIRDHWLQSLKERCQDPKNKCTMIGSKVFFDNGIWYNIDWDIDEVIEVTTSPLTLEGWANTEAFWQQEIFKYAAEHGAPPATENGGHIHLDISHFKHNSALLMNFFTDCQNHPELFLGALGYRPNNPPISLNAEHRDRFEKFLLTHQHDLETNPESWEVEELALNLTDAVYNDGVGSQRTHALNLIPLTRRGRFAHTLEIRGLQGQKSMREFILIIKLFKARLKWLEGSKKLIPYLKKSSPQPLNDIKAKAAPPILKKLKPLSVIMSMRRPE